MLEIFYLRSVEYYKIKQGTLQHNLSKYYRLESAYILYEQFSKFVNTLKKEKEETCSHQNWIVGQFDPWLEQDGEKGNMTDKEILDKYIDLDKSCLLDKVRNQVMDMFYRYKDAFSLRDEIGTCPYIGVEVEIR